MVYLVQPQLQPQLGIPPPQYSASVPMHQSIQFAPPGHVYGPVLPSPPPPYYSHGFTYPSVAPSYEPVPFHQANSGNQACYVAEEQQQQQPRRRPFYNNSNNNNNYYDDNDRRRRRNFRY
jgi:hypothetical protein